MTFTHLHIFIKVYQFENITRAAEVLNMTQPAVSRAIKELEQYYNVCLFERINRRLHRTECSNQLYAQAIHIEESFESMEEQLNSWGHSGIIRIGATVSFGNFLMPELVAKFKEEYSKCTVHVRIANGKQLQDDLKDNSIDFALIEGGVFDTDLEVVPFMNDQLLLIVPPNHELAKRKIKVKELEQYDLLAREWGSSSRDRAEHCLAKHNMKIIPMWESNSTQAIVRAVHLGIGIALLPTHLVAESIQSGFVDVCMVEDEMFSRKNHLVWHKNKFFTTSATAFIKLCKESKNEYEGGNLFDLGGINAGK